MKSPIRCYPSRKAQAAAEYLILLGIVVAVTLYAIRELIPRVVSADGKSGYAVEFFSNVIRQFK